MTAAAHRASYPIRLSTIINTLTATDFRLLHTISNLQRQAERNRPTRTPYAWCSQTWLGSAIARSRETCNRRLKHLADAGALQKIWRRPTHGRYLTCLYIIPHRIRSALAAPFYRKINNPESVTIPAPKLRDSLTLPPEVAGKQPPTTTGAGFAGFIEALRARQR
jgi:hypothetical protein